ncbi:mRNA interferase MazF [Desulfonauticus submarinus]|uniref:mRNA interferase MazF n=1 Tax=Desulfonauticus submarinus TaxID=206665 RepID=A0A1H0F5Q3_9BACT|nr:type II toxin-antitoxin system PemK/MazF family toxin [Desulfonauticus submarinus]SDN34829.1 mRNA interferase MazF [Desulfonauticus submarinus]SDN81017.1 mRNA interferase MazF [Desulfonauticus submarinus]SDN89990.1 mRNA interferase MazF [Desulfonauticus submarinus]
MEKFIKGDVVVIPFPFSDLSGSKRRPALIISNLEGYDLILCQITSKNIKDKYAIDLKDDDFAAGGLRQESNIRPNKIFTADKDIILYKIGSLKIHKLQEVINRIIEIIK